MDVSVLWAILGVVVGSCISMMSYRLPMMMKRQWHVDATSFLAEHESAAFSKRVSLFSPRSFCTHCKQPIPWRANIPLLGFLFSRGQCLHCHKKISLRYPLIEFACGTATLFVILHFGPTSRMCAALFLTWGLLVLSVIDFEEKFLPDGVTLSLLWVGLLLSTQTLFVSMNDAIWGAAIGYGVLWSVASLYQLLRGHEGMGHGDFKLTAMWGAWLGWQALPLIIMGAALSAALVGIAMLVFKKANRLTEIPFGPYLAVAGWLVLLNQHWVTYFYQQVLR